MILPRQYSRPNCFLDRFLKFILVRHHITFKLRMFHLWQTNYASYEESTSCTKRSLFWFLYFLEFVQKLNMQAVNIWDNTWLCVSLQLFRSVVSLSGLITVVLASQWMFHFQITPSRPLERSKMTKRLKTVSRTYGGSRCHKCVRERSVLASVTHCWLLLVLKFLALKLNI